MWMRPILIFVLSKVSFFDKETEKEGPNIENAIVWAEEECMYFLFYFLIFKMRIIEILLSFSINQ